MMEAQIVVMIIMFVLIGGVTMFLQLVWLEADIKIVTITAAICAIVLLVVFITVPIPVTEVNPCSATVQHQ